MSTAKRPNQRKQAVNSRAAKAPSGEATSHSALERVLAYVSIGIIAIAVASYLTTLIVAMAMGREVLAQGMWQVVVFISYVGLPIGFVLLMVLLGINFRRRGKAQ